ncbi:hypothetical protein [Streptosporangium pseudovulgare]|uniref:Uncharacterized protein n=1 Tax=Streptosporangium pseudovulgare TaxID=35765 RepID=A0ABQ2RCB1_9ACTN|nr:hypothetical protein [Streptosporangium pseudovulgare]GGQ21051.1 hypothetical protein GCM10010140_59150 [Streptosporangium pseudovulgare]
MSLGLSGAVLLAAAPLTAPIADPATVLVADTPGEVPGCGTDPAAPCDEEPTPVVTVTVTAPPEEESPAPPKPAPRTVHTTVIVPPKTTKTPKPTKTVRETVTVPAPQQTSAPPVEPPPTTPANEPVTPPTTSDPDPSFPSTETQPQPTAIPTATPQPSDTPFEETAPAPVRHEIRNAGSEFDSATLSGQLAIPALILVLLVLFAVLIFEGRLRRLAHAAAVRRAGPRSPAYRGPADPMAYPAGPAAYPVGPAAYPAGPGYAAAPGFPPGTYQGGTAYAPIVSLVPMHMYPQGYPEGYAPEAYGRPYEHPYGGQPYETAYLPPGHEHASAGYPPGHEHAPAGYPLPGHEHASAGYPPYAEPYGPAGHDEMYGAVHDEAMAPDVPGTFHPLDEDAFPGPAARPAGPGDLPPGEGDDGLPRGAAGHPGPSGEAGAGRGGSPSSPERGEPGDHARGFFEPARPPAGEARPGESLTDETRSGAESPTGPAGPAGGSRSRSEAAPAPATERAPAPEPGPGGPPPSGRESGFAEAPSGQEPVPGAFPGQEPVPGAPSGAGPTGTVTHPLPERAEGRKKRGLFRRSS